MSAVCIAREMLVSRSVRTSASSEAEISSCSAASIVWWKWGRTPARMRTRSAGFLLCVFSMSSRIAVMAMACVARLDICVIQGLGEQSWVVFPEGHVMGGMYISLVEQEGGPAGWRASSGCNGVHV